MSEQMKLSEAIREGAKLRPQTFFSSFGKNINGELCSCAWGAAHEAITGSTDIGFKGAEMYRTHADIVSKEIKNPVTGSITIISETITDLNDFALWTREQIADWLKEKGY